MTALVPRIFGDIGEWFETDFPLAGMRAYSFRVEDFMRNGDYVLRAELPGVDPENDVQITVDHGILDIRAERREETRDRYRSEFRYGSLHRTMRLPEGAEEDKIKARYESGILEITVPIRSPEESVGRAIPIERKS